MSILVPSYLTAPYQTSNEVFDVRSFYAWSQLTGETVNMPSLIKELQRLRRSHLIRWVTCMHVWLSKQNGLDMKMQAGHAKGMLPHMLWTKLENLIISEGKTCGAIFHKRQLWLLMQIACLACSEETPELSEKEANEAFIKVCLMTNDILTGIELPMFGSEATEESPEEIIAKIIPMIERGIEAKTLVRAYAFWFDLQSTPELERVPPLVES